MNVLAGGSDEALEMALPLFKTFSRSVFHMGPCGSGARMKLVSNLVLGLNRAVLAEGLVSPSSSASMRRWRSKS